MPLVKVLLRTHHVSESMIDLVEENICGSTRSLLMESTLITALGPEESPIGAEPRLFDDGRGVTSAVNHELVCDNANFEVVAGRTDLFNVDSPTVYSVMEHDSIVSDDSGHEEQEGEGSRGFLPNEITEFRDSQSSTTDKWLLEPEDDVIGSRVTTKKLQDVDPAQRWEILDLLWDQPRHRVDQLVSILNRGRAESRYYEANTYYGTVEPNGGQISVETCIDTSKSTFVAEASQVKLTNALGALGNTAAAMAQNTKASCLWCARRFPFYQFFTHLSEHGHSCLICGSVFSTVVYLAVGCLGFPNVLILLIQC